MHARLLRLVVPTLAIAAAPAGAQTPYTLTAYCQLATVPQTWGDAPGIADFSYDVRSGFGGGRAKSGNLTGWGTGYSDLPCAFWGGNAGERSWVGEIAAIPDGTSNTIRFDEVSIGRWGNSPRTVELRLYDDDYSTLLFSTSTVVDGTAITIFIGETVQGPARLQWDHPWEIGVGSVGVTVDPGVATVPEPGSLALTALGLGALATAVRRRRAA